MSIERPQAPWPRATGVVLAILLLAAEGWVAVLPAAAQPPAVSPASPQANGAAPSTATAGRVAAVLRFAVASRTALATDTPSGQACPSGVDAAAKPDPKRDAALALALRKALVKALAAKIAVEAEESDPADLRDGVLIIAGCLTHIDPGNAAGRMIGMEIGASELAAHVAVFTKTPDGLSPVQAFDVKARGGALLPPLGPIGLVMHGVKEIRETLSADADRLAGDIAGRVAKSPQSHEKGQL